MKRVERYPFRGKQWARPVQTTREECGLLPNGWAEEIWLRQEKSKACEGSVNSGPRSRNAWPHQGL